MKVQLGAYLLLPVVLLLLVACGETGSPPPATLPTDSPPTQTAKPLSASDRMAMDEFTTQQQAIDQEWDQLHREFDHWRAGLTACHRSSAQEALQDFAVSFNSVTEQARGLPRTSVTLKLADLLIEAAEEEEAAFRHLRDRWQPNSPSLFEQVEEGRSNAARAQKDVEDRIAELQEEFGEEFDPEELEAVEEFSVAFDVVKDDWKMFNDDYTDLYEELDNLDIVAVLDRLEGLTERLNNIVEAVQGLPSADATQAWVVALQAAAEKQRGILGDLTYALAGLPFATVVPPTVPPLPDGVPTPPAPTVPPPPGLGPGPTAGLPLDDMNALVKDIEALLKETSRKIKAIVDDSLAEDLADVQDFNHHYKSLLVEWDAFHQRYNHWRRTEGGCDRTEVLQALDQFNLRAGELGRKVRDLPQSSYLLPMYTLMVEAVELEEGSIRALRNSWQPFAVDAFKAVDQERANANRLRRQAGIGLQELKDRS